MKKDNIIEYDYIVHHVSDGASRGYKAVIPAFGSVVFGDDLDELERGIALAIAEEKKHRKKKNTPAPDSIQTYSGKFVVRTRPAIHEKLVLEAKARGKSLNAYIQEKISV